MRRIGLWRGFALIVAGFALARLAFEGDILGRMMSLAILASVLPALILGDTRSKRELEPRVFSLETATIVGVVGVISVEDLLRRGNGLLSIVVGAFFAFLYFLSIIGHLSRRHA